MSPRRNDVRAAIDIGTNSIHLVVARIDQHGGIEVLTREKESVRLGEGAGEMSRLADDAINRGIAVLARMRRVADVYGATIDAVATSAVREASNRDVFIRRAAEEAGIDVQVISGVEEARLIHLGVLQAVPVFDKRHLVIDIGGGSTEFVVGVSGQELLARSVKLGAIRVTDRFFADGVVKARAVTECREYLGSYLAPLIREVNDLSFDVAVGSSGTINCIATMSEGLHGRDTSHGVNNVAFTRVDLDAVISLLLDARTTAERLEITGLDAKRADIIVGGALLLEAIFDHLKIDKMVVSEYALREGVLFNTASSDRQDAFHHLSDIRRQGVARVLDQYERDRGHVEHSTDLALRLFDETAELHGLGSDARDLLEASGVMHNVGLFVSHSAHHKHSYYVIRNSDQLVGFSQREVELMAQIARYHRKGNPGTRHAEFAALTPADQDLVNVLAGLLRVGIALDRSHSAAVTDLRFTKTEPDCATIEVNAVPEHDLSLELYAANQRIDLLNKALGWTVDVIAAP